jgi:hypothetical protein
MSRFAALLGVALFTWSASGLALDRVRAIETAKKALRERCAVEGACTFDATRAEGKWRVRVDFAKAGARKSKTAPVIFLINDAGRIVGRIGSQPQ